LTVLVVEMPNPETRDSIAPSKNAITSRAIALESLFSFIKTSF